MNSAATDFDGENKYIRITDIDENSSRYKSETPVSPEGILADKYIVQENDILFARTGASTGKTYIYNATDGKLYFAGFLIRARVLTSYNARFIFAQTQTENYSKWVKLMSMRSGQPGINSQEYSSFTFNVPLKLEQDKIANFLTLIDERISTQNKIIEELNVFKTIISKRIFSQQLRFKDNDGNDFADWEKKKLKDVANIRMGQSPDSSSYNNDDNGIPLIQGNADIKDRKSNPRQYTNSPTKLCEIGDVLLTVRAPVGYVAKSFHNACIGRGICSLKSNEYSMIEFIYQFLLYFENSWKSLEQGSTFTSVNSSDIGSVSLNVPSIEEQTKIANFFSFIDSKIKIETQLLQKLEEQKKYLLQSLFI